MRFAIDENGKRIIPTFSGQRAKCQLCNETLIGKCGDIYVHHWQHHHNYNCDTWKEHETEWHRQWKARFPSDWQEVKINKEGEKHIADIETSAGLVIEFQNSSISGSTIREREEFYKDLIWVVNAISFKDNFKIRSLVRSELKKIERNASHEEVLLKDLYKNDLIAIEEEIKKNEFETKLKHENCDNNRMKLEKLQHILNDKETFTNSVIEHWVSGQIYWDYFTYDIESKINPEMKSSLQEISAEINKLQTDLEFNQKKISDIMNLEDFFVYEKQFKLVQYEDISSKYYIIARAISKDSRGAIFPDIIEFKSEAEFKNFHYRKEHFDFVLDLSDVINLRTQNILKAENELSSLDMLFHELKITIAKELIEELTKKIHEIEKNIEKLIDELKESKSHNSRLIKQQSQMTTTWEAAINESKIDIEKKMNKKKSDVMSNYKGLYQFDWKHERKTWKEAVCTIFFDIGESYLFELVDDGLFKKTEIKEFLKKYLS